jgi:hypothetical protein
VTSHPDTEFKGQADIAPLHSTPLHSKGQADSLSTSSNACWTLVY